MTTADEAMEATIWVTNSSKLRSGGVTPTTANPSVTCKANQPPFAQESRSIEERKGGWTRTHGGVEEAAADAEEDPDIDHEREAKGQADVEQLGKTGRRRLPLQVVGDLGGGQSEEEEQEGAGELAAYGDEVIADSVGHPSHVRKPTFRRGLVGIVRCHDGDGHDRLSLMDVEVG